MLLTIRENQFFLVDLYFILLNRLNKWSQEGCYKITNDSNVTTCHCYHLTTFASLMQVSSSNVSYHFHHSGIMPSLLYFIFFIHSLFSFLLSFSSFLSSYLLLYTSLFLFLSSLVYLFPCLLSFLFSSLLLNFPLHFFSFIFIYFLFYFHLLFCLNLL